MHVTDQHAKWALRQVRKAQRTARLLEDRGALRVSVVTGGTQPYQGWVSAGSGNPVPAPVVVVSQSAKGANIHTTITPGRVNGAPFTALRPSNEKARKLPFTG